MKVCVDCGTEHDRPRTGRCEACARKHKAEVARAHRLGVSVGSLHPVCGCGEVLREPSESGLCGFCVEEQNPELRAGTWAA